MTKSFLMEIYINNEESFNYVTLPIHNDGPFANITNSNSLISNDEDDNCKNSVLNLCKK